MKAVLPRKKFYEAVRELVKKHNPDAVAVICEAWCLYDLSGKLEQPSKSPKRKECVFVTVDSRDKQVTCAAEIRDRINAIKGKMLQLGIKETVL